MPPKKKAYQKAAVLPAGSKLRDSMKHEWSITKLLAEGGFGHVYLAKAADKTKYKGEYVIKIEPQGNGPLFTEIHVYQKVAKADKIDEFTKSKKLRHLAIPPYIGSGILSDKKQDCRFLVMPRFGRDLESIREKRRNGVFSLPIVVNVTTQCLRALEYLHAQQFVHADMKAENLLIDNQKTSFTDAQLTNAVFYLTDFGLAKRVDNSPDDRPDKKRAHNGTLPFTSLDAHNGRNPSMRGDLEILAYNMLYWLTGTLPWFHNENPDAVCTAKTKFSNNYKTDCARILRLKADDAATTLVTCMFQAAYTCRYGDSIDFGALHKLVSCSCKPTPKRSSSIKSPSIRGRGDHASTSTIDSVEKNKTKRKPAAATAAKTKRPKAVPKSGGHKLAAVVDSESESEESDEENDKSDRSPSPAPVTASGRGGRRNPSTSTKRKSATPRTSRQRTTTDDGDGEWQADWVSSVDSAVSDVWQQDWESDEEENDSDIVPDTPPLSPRTHAGSSSTTKRYKQKVKNAAKVRNHVAPGKRTNIRRVSSGQNRTAVMKHLTRPGLGIVPGLVNMKRTQRAIAASMSGSKATNKTSESHKPTKKSQIKVPKVDMNTQTSPYLWE